ATLRAPRAPPFPYTTLFRSRVRAGMTVDMKRPPVSGEGCRRFQASDRRTKAVDRLDGCAERASIVSEGHLRERDARGGCWRAGRSEEHTSELQSRENLVCRL